MAGRDDIEASAAEAGPGRYHWFEGVADFLGPAYLRYSFTKGTEQEVDFLVEVAGLSPGDRVLDVGCGPGRHSWSLAARGMTVLGVDVAERFVALAAVGAPAGAAFVRGDARSLPVAPGSFDLVVSLCQGGFGLLGDDDPRVLAGMAEAVRPGGVLVLSAFSAYFAVRHLEGGETLDANRGVVHERTTLTDAAGATAEADLWTSVFTPRELRLLAARAGLAVEHVWSVTPGAYRPGPPDAEHPEFLVVARRPAPDTLR